LELNTDATVVILILGMAESRKLQSYFVSPKTYCALRSVYDGAEATRKSLRLSKYAS
jgi:hypothetical protein